MTSRRMGLAVVLLVLLVPLVWSGGSGEPQGGGGAPAEKVTVSLLSHRYPAVEFYAQALSDEAPANVRVVGDLMPYDKYIEKAKINLSAGSSAYDIYYANAGGVADFASKGWIIPLDSYIKKYEKEFNFKDFFGPALDVVTYKGKIYGIPLLVNVYFYFYRDDLLQQAGAKPARTLDEYLTLSEKLTTPDRYGTSLSLRPVDFLRNEFHSYLIANGGTWFDNNTKPIFNSDAGVAAVNYILKLAKFAPQGVLGYGNDESTVAMQQDKVAMMLQWASRCAPMDNPELSKVVGKVKWGPGPSLRANGIPAGILSAGDCYTISAFSKNDPELLFRMIAQVSDAETMKRGAATFFPTRLSLSQDPEMISKYRYYPAVAETVQRGVISRPNIPEYEEVCDLLTKRLAQALSGEMGAKQALDLAQQEAVTLMKERGYKY